MRKNMIIGGEHQTESSTLTSCRIVVGLDICKCITGYVKCMGRRF
jgi:hypothetical protein